jgi:WD40 repeat protein
VKVFQKDQDQIWSVALSPNGRRVVAAGDALTVWDVFTGKQVGTLKKGAGVVTSVVFSPDGRRVVSGGQDRILRVWATSK